MEAVQSSTSSAECIWHLGKKYGANYEWVQISEQTWLDWISTRTNVWHSWFGPNYAWKLCVCSTFNKSTQFMPNQIKKPFKHPSNQGQQKLGKLALRRQWSIFVGIKSNRSTPRNRSFDRSGPNWTIEMPSKMNLLCLALAMSALVAAAQAARGETEEEAQGSNEIKIDVKRISKSLIEYKYVVQFHLQHAISRFCCAIRIF